MCTTEYKFLFECRQEVREKYFGCKRRSRGYAREDIWGSESKDNAVKESSSPFPQNKSFFCRHDNMEARGGPGSEAGKTNGAIGFLFER